MPNIKELDIVYMNIAGEVSQLSKANRKKVGAIIVKDNNILSFGYNGTPSGFDNTCEENNKTKWYVCMWGLADFFGSNIKYGHLASF